MSKSPASQKCFPFRHVARWSQGVNRFGITNWMSKKSWCGCLFPRSLGHANLRRRERLGRTESILSWCLLQRRKGLGFTPGVAGKSRQEKQVGLHFSVGRVGTCARSVVSDSLWRRGLQPTRLFCPCDFPGKNIGMASHSLLWWIFPAQGSNLRLLCLLHCKWILYRRSSGKAPWGTRVSSKTEPRAG